MYRIIGNRASGKTSNLLLLAKENNGTVVCKNPKAMQEKAWKYGLAGIGFMSYQEFFIERDADSVYYIDEIEDFLSFAYDKQVKGYTLTNA